MNYKIDKNGDLSLEVSICVSLVIPGSPKWSPGCQKWSLKFFKMPVVRINSDPCSAGSQSAVAGPHSSLKIYTCKTTEKLRGMRRLCRGGRGAQRNHMGLTSGSHWFTQDWWLTVDSHQTHIGLARNRLTLEQQILTNNNDDDETTTTNMLKYA